MPRLVNILFAPLLGALAVPAHADVVASSDTDFVTRTAADVPAPPFDVWAALIAPARWWSAEHTWSGKSANLYIDSQATGCFCELLPAPENAPAGTRRGSVEHLHIISAMPGQMLRMTGGLGPLQDEPVRGLLTITMKARDGGGSHIEFEYKVGGLMTLKGGDIAPAVDKVLSEQLSHLAGLFGSPSPEPKVPAEG